MNISQPSYGSVIFTVAPGDVVPVEGRSAWLTLHGPFAETPIQVTATLAAWEEAGIALDPAGAPVLPLNPAMGYVGPVRQFVRRTGEAIVARLRAYPTDASSFNATPILEQIAAERSEALELIATPPEEGTLDQADRARELDWATPQGDRARGGYGWASAVCDLHRAIEQARALLAVDPESAADQPFSPREADLREPLLSQVRDWLARRAAWQAAQAKAKQEQADALMAARRAEQRALIVEHGASEMLERFDGNVLPEHEIVGMLMGVLLPKPPALAAYLPLDDKDAECDCSDPDIQYRVVRYTLDAEKGVERFDSTISAEFWAAIKAVRAAHPTARLYLVRHEVECRNSGCPSATTRWSIRVRIDVAGLKLQRNYASRGVA